MKFSAQLRCGVLIALATRGSAAMRLPAIFSEHMVLQAGVNAPVWGWAEDGEEITIAGADKRWIWANARIAGDTVIVSHPDVHSPVADRYAWADNPVAVGANLYNGAGVPASQFRTDAPEIAERPEPHWFMILIRAHTQMRRRSWQNSDHGEMMGDPPITFASARQMKVRRASPL